jgi:hypothetical protein
MSHISCQKRQLCLNVCTLSVPADQGIHSKTVTKIMNAWGSAIWSLYLPALEELLQRAPQ